MPAQSSRKHLSCYEVLLDITKVAILYNARIPTAPALAARMENWMAGRVDQVRRCAIEDTSGPSCLPEADLLVTLGGDGSILYAARLAAPRELLVLGVNLGRVGFLTEAETGEWTDVLSSALAGDYWVEERMMIRQVSRRGEQVIAEAEALNDVVVGRAAHARSVHLCVEVDGGELTTYVADGLIVATPTGSTAYALAAGGPILPPQLRNILLVPVAPHLSMERPIVLAEGVKVRIAVVGHRPAVLTVDGHAHAALENGDTVAVEASRHVARFARVREPTYFYKTLVSRLVPRNDK